MLGRGKMPCYLNERTRFMAKQRAKRSGKGKAKSSAKRAGPKKRGAKGKARTVVRATARGKTAKRAARPTARRGGKSPAPAAGRARPAARRPAAKRPERPRVSIETPGPVAEPMSPESSGIASGMFPPPVRPFEPAGEHPGVTSEPFGAGFGEEEPEGEDDASGGNF